MGHSLAQAVSHVPHGTLVVGLSDMPFVRPESISQLVRTLRQSPDTAIVQPSCNGTPGNPLGFGAAHREALTQAAGDQGARRLVKRAKIAGTLQLVEVADDGVLRDIDRPQDLPSH